MKIQVVGLGYGDEKLLPYEAARILQTTKPIWLRTEKHPVVLWMKEKGIHFHTFDHKYEEHLEFATVYEQIVQSLFQLAKAHSTVVYAVPGHPMVAERTVQLLLERSQQEGIEVEIVSGTSFLEGVFSRLHIDPIEGFSLLDGSDLRQEQLNPRLHQLIGQVYSRLVASDVKLTLMELYPVDTKVTIATALGIPHQEKITTLSLYQLDHQELFTDFTSIYIPPIHDPLALPRRFDTLVYLFEYLRSPNGCPWDRKQTHKSLREYLIEETYEFLDAVTSNDEEAMMDELGDVLLQVMLHSQIAKESETFDVYDVIENLTKKMIRRHPHVFGDQQVNQVSDVKRNWEEIKRREKKQDNHTSLLTGIPQGLPALTMAYQLQKKAKKVGFDWKRKEELGGKLTEEILELFQANTQSEVIDEMGDVLFTVVNLARFFDVQPEIALLDACQKFKRRFLYMEKKAEQEGKSLQQFSLEQLDHWWNEEKKSTE